MLRAEVLNQIAPAMKYFSQQHGILGIATLLMHQGQIVHQAHTGWQDTARQVPLAANTIYRIYSMTKPVVCAAFLRLVEQERVALVTPLAHVLPAFANLNVLTRVGHRDHLEALRRPVYLVDLLTHTAGFTYDFFEDNPVAQQYREARLMADATRTLSDYVETLATLPLAYQPGDRWHYSVGLDVLARVIEVVSGESFPVFLAEHILDPLQMCDTAFSVPPEKRMRLAHMSGCTDVATSTLSEIVRAQEVGECLPCDVESTYPSYREGFARGGHGLFSTLTDYARFSQMLLNEGELDGRRVLSPQSVRFMRGNRVQSSLLPISIGPVSHAGYGFGATVRVRVDAGACLSPGANGEFGWEGAARTSFWVDPQNAMVGVLMMQHMLGRDWPEREFRTLAYSAMRQ